MTEPIVEVRYAPRRTPKAPKRGKARLKLTLRARLSAWKMPPLFQWGQLRYKNPFEKGVYWYWFSLFIRRRDFDIWGTCISCGKPITVDTSQGGHFIPASTCGRDLLFDEKNVNAECGRCNAFDEGHLFGYEINLDKRYGAGTAQGLKDRLFAYKELISKAEAPRDWSAKQYAEKIYTLSSYGILTDYL